MFINFLHTFTPQPVLIEIGPITVYWYGFFMALAILAGLLVSIKIAKLYDIKKETIYDLFFYLIIFGFLGARLFYILYNPVYFWQNPLDVFKIWQGGLAIHGGLVAGILVLLSFPRRRESREKGMLLKQLDSRLRGDDNKNKFWQLASIIAPGLALGQAIGRWGNYFNQELFGLPTDLPWGIPIALANRSAGFENFTYFHPTFLYESFGNFFIFCLLLMFHWFLRSKTHNVERTTHNTSDRYALCVICYALLYSILRFFIEFLRIDPTAGNIFGVRATMGLSAGIIILCMIYLVYYKFFTKQS